MATKNQSSNTKTVAFSVTQNRNPDGSITLTPTKIADGREVGTSQAAEFLGINAKGIRQLARIGAISAWKTESKRGNSKLRINFQSLIDYREKRTKDMRRD